MADRSATSASRSASSARCRPESIQVKSHWGGPFGPGIFFGGGCGARKRLLASLEKLRGDRDVGCCRLTRTQHCQKRGCPPPTGQHYSRPASALAKRCAACQHQFITGGRGERVVMSVKAVNIDGTMAMRCRAQCAIREGRSSDPGSRAMGRAGKGSWERACLEALLTSMMLIDLATRRCLAVCKRRVRSRAGLRAVHCVCQVVGTGRRVPRPAPTRRSPVARSRCGYQPVAGRKAAREIGGGEAGTERARRVNPARHRWQVPGREPQENNRRFGVAGTCLTARNSYPSFPSRPKTRAPPGVRLRKPPIARHAARKRAPTVTRWAMRREEP